MPNIGLAPHFNKMIAGFPRRIKKWSEFWAQAKKFDYPGVLEEIENFESISCAVHGFGVYLRACSGALAQADYAARPLGLSLQ